MTNLTNQEIGVVLQLVDAGIKAAGLQIYQDARFAQTLGSAVDKLHEMAREQAGADEQPAPETPEGESA